jgi:hypothetical protein
VGSEKLKVKSEKWMLESGKLKVKSEKVKTKSGKWMLEDGSWRYYIRPYLRALH